MISRFNYILDYIGINPYFVKTSPYDQVYELGKTAVERFGKDPATFKETLKKYKTKNYQRTIKKEALNMPSDRLRFDSWNIREYINCLTAILQVDLEVPGFIKNFPEAIEYLKLVNGNSTNRVSHDFEELYNKTLKPFNRYSEKSDFKYIKSLFEIPDEKKNKRYDEKEPRFDDYISIKFLEFWKSGDDEKREYLREYYIYQETLLPKDYRGIIRYLNLLKDVELEENDLKWVDLYFEHQDEILEAVYKDIYSMSPKMMKKINLTLT
jgi:hypothetical protein